jgi:hypothetical protein
MGAMLRVRATRRQIAPKVSDRAFRDAKARALEFMLSHRLYRSDKTGDVISERFTHLAHPRRCDQLA